jgi:hypothetical protein
MFAVIAIIAVLLAILVPAIQKAREAARQTQCKNNLKQICLSLLNYHDTYKMFPMGAMHSGPKPGGDPPIQGSLGPSWWFSQLPFYESSPLYDQISVALQSGSPVAPEFCANDMKAMGRPLNFKMYGYICPSSSLPVMETPTGPICLPSYVGIAGGCDIDPDSPDCRASGSIPGLAVPATSAVYRNRFKGTGATVGGIVASSGMLPPCQHIRASDCTDGTQNTMIVGEQSDWLLDQNPALSRKFHGDPGWTVGGTGSGGGWLSGTRRVDPVPKVETPGDLPANWGADCWNVATVRYPPNFKRVMGTPCFPGCSENHGINNPLQSPHPSGLHVGMVDGSVHFISQDQDLAVLLRLAIRDDVQELGRD